MILTQIDCSLVLLYVHVFNIHYGTICSGDGEGFDKYIQSWLLFFFYYISIDSYTMNFQDLHHLLEFLSLLLKALYIDTQTNHILLVPFSIPYGSLYQSS